MTWLEGGEDTEVRTDSSSLVPHEDGYTYTPESGAPSYVLQEAAMSNEFHIVEDAQMLDRSGFVRGGVAFAGGLVGLLSLARSAAAVPGLASWQATAAQRSGVIYGDLLSRLPRGGRVEILLGGPDTLNFLITSTLESAAYSYPAHDFLEYYDHTGRLVPSLAERMEVLDSRRLRYTLHENARFHNGRRVTSRDVKATFEWVQDPKNKSTKVDFVRGVKVRVVSDRVLVIELPRPDAGFRAGLPNIPIMPVETMSRQASHPIGCGPFLFKRWVRGAFIEYVRNPRYWNPAAPRVDTLRLRQIAGPSLALAFLAGSGDFVFGVGAAQLKEFQERARRRRLKLKSSWSSVTFIAINHRRPPFDDRRVRRALTLAIDRPAMVRLAHQGLGRPAWVHGAYPGSPFYDASIKFERDLGRARELLREARHGGGFDAGALTTWAGFGDLMAAVVQSNLAEIGVKVDIKTVDEPTGVDVQNRRDYGLFLTAWVNEPEPSALLDQLFRSDGGTNFMDYRNPEVDRLLRQARSTYSQARRKTLYGQAMRLLFVTDVAAIPMTQLSDLIAYRNWTNGRQYGPNPNTLYWHYPVASTRRRGS